MIKVLENSRKMLQLAKKDHYAVPHFNINNLEWAKFILEECESLQIPVILGVSEGAAHYMGGYVTVTNMVKGLLDDLKITIPVCLHLDHGKSVESCKEAIDAGFTSVMIDTSSHPLEENIHAVDEVVKYAHQRDVTVEAELGHIGGSEDGIVASSLFARVEECEELYDRTGIDSLAPALGSVHGFYHGEANLDFQTMQQIADTLPIPLVLHGGTGIPYEKIQKAISHGICKININTELQVVWNRAVRQFIASDQTAYDPRKIISSGEAAIKEKVRELAMVFKTVPSSTK